MTPLQLHKAFKVLAHAGTTIQFVVVCTSGDALLIVGSALLWVGTSLSIHQLGK
jgi:hypothetical protein